MGYIDGMKRWAIAAFAAIASVWVSVVLSAPAQAQTPPVINCQGRPVTQLDFSGPTPVLATGTVPQVGETYSYSNVAPGVDAEVEIVAFVNGGSLITIDTDAGLVNYFQPELANAVNQDSAVDFRISFFDSTTNSPVELDIAASSIDVDGNNGTVANDDVVREYVEFEDTLVGYVLSNTTELAMNVGNAQTIGNRRFESSTMTVAPGIDPTAENNIVTIFYTNVSAFDFRIGTLGNGGTDRLTSLGFNCPNLQSPAVSTTTPEDFGDAPVNNYGNPIHTLVNGIRLGAVNNADAGSYDSPTATGDSGDDGVSVPNFIQGETKSIPVSVTGSGGRLQAWFDWNADGDFLDNGEQVATNVQDTLGSGTINLSVSAPITASTGMTFARFRWATDANLSYQDQTDDGEVEDYQFTITSAPSDYSDAPLTGTSYGDAQHLSQQGLTLGAGVTTESAGFDTPNADGDVDDGVTIPTLTQGQASSITANVTGAGGFLQGWIDWNDDGDWADAGEQIAADLQDGDTDGIISIPVTPPANAATSQTIARFRWSTDSGLNSNDLALNGEVEDYALTVSPSNSSGLTCPAGLTPTSGFGNADSVSTPAQFSAFSLGGLSPVDTTATSSNSARVSNGGNTTLTLQLGDIVPGGADITISIARNITSSAVEIGGSLNTTSFTNMSTFNADFNNILQRITVTAPAGGMEYIQFLRTSGRVWIDGVEYDDICATPTTPDLQADKSVAVYDPTNIGLYALPDNDVIYTITVSNAGDGAADTDSIELIDILPSDIEFWNGDIDAGGPDTYPGTEPVGFTQPSGTGMSLTYGTDIRFGTGATAPADYSACTAVTPDGTYRPDLTFICFNPKGTLAAGDPDPEITLNFRARIK